MQTSEKKNIRSQKLVLFLDCIWSIHSDSIKRSITSVPNPFRPHFRKADEAVNRARIDFVYKQCAGVVRKKNQPAPTPNLNRRKSGNRICEFLGQFSETSAGTRTQYGPCLSIFRISKSFSVFLDNILARQTRLRVFIPMTAHPISRASQSLVI